MPVASRRPLRTAEDSIALGASTATRSVWPRKPGVGNEAASKLLSPTSSSPRSEGIEAGSTPLTDDASTGPPTCFTTAPDSVTREIRPV